MTLRFALVALLLAAASSAPAEPGRDPQRIGRLRVGVESVRRCRPVASCLSVTLHASALARNERAPVRRVQLVDVQGRRLAPREPQELVLRPGFVTFTFDVPQNFAVVAIELDDVSFEISHAGPLTDVMIGAE